MEVENSKLKSTLTKNRKFIIDNVSSVNPIIDFLADDSCVEEKDNIKSWSASKVQVGKLCVDILGIKLKYFRSFI